MTGGCIFCFSHRSITTNYAYHKAVFAICLFENSVFVMEQERVGAEEAANIITSWDTDDELSDEEDEDAMQVVDDISAPTSCQLSDGSSDEDSDEEERDIGAAPMQGLQTPNPSEILGRNGSVWTSSPVTLAGRTQARNVFTSTPEVTRSISNAITSPYCAWKHFIHETILRSIVKFTNEEATRRGDREFCLSADELELFIALQYARGLYGKNHPVHFLWNKVYGIAIFQKTMSRNRFTTILKYLRFDDKPNRIRQGDGADKFAPIREVFDIFASMCKTKYTCNYSLTVDEQLLPVKSRCSFISFMPNKPDKYGVKFWVLVDVETKYVSNIIPYLGAQEKEQRGGLPLGESVVLKLTEHVKGRGYNVCCDNFFTSLPLAEKLSRNKLSIVGTIRKNRRDLAAKMTEPRKGCLHTSQFFWHKNSGAMLVNYQPKANRTVCLLSTMHSSPEVDETTLKKKPEVILFYNKNKVSVDTFDQMARLYSAKSPSRRWPLSVWGNILDIAAINAHILYTKSTGIRISRRNFILKVIESLRHQSQENAADDSIFDLVESVGFQRKRKKCRGSGCKNATEFMCHHCKKPACGKCSQANSKLTFVKCNSCV